MYFYEGKFQCCLDCKDIKEVENRLNLVMQNALYLKRYREMEYVDFYHLGVFEDRCNDDDGMCEKFLGFFFLELDYVLVSRSEEDLNLVKAELNDTLLHDLEPMNYSTSDVILHWSHGSKNKILSADAAWYLESKYGFGKK